MPVVESWSYSVVQLVTYFPLPVDRSAFGPSRGSFVSFTIYPLNQWMWIILTPKHIMAETCDFAFGKIPFIGKTHYDNGARCFRPWQTWKSRVQVERTKCDTEGPRTFIAPFYGNQSVFVCFGLGFLVIFDLLETSPTCQILDLRRSFRYRESGILPNCPLRPTAEPGWQPYSTTKYLSTPGQFSPPFCKSL